MLLGNCDEFGKRWRINFNPSKSVVLYLSYEFGKRCEEREFYVNGSALRRVDSMIYLGLPICNHKFKENY